MVAQVVAYEGNVMGVERRDLRLKLLEIYFVGGNKEAFLQTAKSLESSRDRAPPGEWDKIVIMGRQIGSTSICSAIRKVRPAR